MSGTDPQRAHMMESIVLSDIISEQYKSSNTLSMLRDDFARSGLLTISNFLTDQVMQHLRDECKYLDKIREKKYFIMPGYNTPRALSVIGGSKILKYSNLIPSLYIHHSLKGALSKIVGRDLFTVKHREECIVVNSMEGKGQTHGWHLDDPNYAFIIVLETPEPEVGGEVECVRNWRWLCQTLGIDPIKDVARGVVFAEESGLVERLRVRSGDCYLLQASDHLHRVTPLLDAGVKRKVINMAFDDREEITFGSTADILYSTEKFSNEGRAVCRETLKARLF